MMRRLACLSLLFAWLCASGAMLDLTQVVAWARMFRGYAAAESVGAAARDTFDPAKPCALCQAVSKARAASGPAASRALSAGLEKIVLVCPADDAFVVRREAAGWTDTDAPYAPSRAEKVPLPPPRIILG